MLYLGAGGGVVALILTYPLVSISSRLQVQRGGEGKDEYKVRRPSFASIMLNYVLTLFC